MKKSCLHGDGSWVELSMAPRTKDCVVNIAMEAQMAAKENVVFGDGFRSGLSLRQLWKRTVWGRAWTWRVLSLTRSMVIGRHSAGV